MDERKEFEKRWPTMDLDVWTPAKDIAWQAWQARAAMVAPVQQEPVAIADHPVVAALLKVSQAAFWACDGTCDDGDPECVHMPHEEFKELSEALDVLDELPDDKPGVTMDGPARAYWALSKPQPDHAEALNQWATIDTAPKNGDEILLVSVDGDIAVCYWRDDNVLRGWTWGLGKPFLNPTHWMPLPCNPNLQHPASQKGGA